MKSSLVAATFVALSSSSVDANKKVDEVKNTDEYWLWSRSDIEQREIRREEILEDAWWDKFSKMISDLEEDDDDLGDVYPEKYLNKWYIDRETDKYSIHSSFIEDTTPMRSQWKYDFHYFNDLVFNVSDVKAETSGTLNT